MNPEQTVAEHIEYLHKKVKTLQLTKITEEEIIACLKNEDAIDELYARTLIDNAQTDKQDRIGFWELIVAGTISLAAAAFTLIAPFYGYFGGRIFIWMIGLCFVAGVIFIFRAFVLFKK